MKKLLAVCMLLGSLVLGLSQPTTNSPSVLVAWDMVTDPAVNGYRVYWGAATRNYTNWVTVVGRTNTMASITNLVRATTYYFAATSTGTNGLESVYSNEATYTTSPLPPAPVGTRASTLTP